MHFFINKGLDFVQAVFELLYVIYASSKEL